MCTLPEKQILSGKFRCRLHWLMPVLVIVVDHNCTPFCKCGHPGTSHSSEWFFFYPCPGFIPEDTSSCIVWFCLLFFNNSKHLFSSWHGESVLEAEQIEAEAIQSWGNENFWRRIFVAQLFASYYQVSYFMLGSPGCPLQVGKGHLPFSMKGSLTYVWPRHHWQNKLWVISEDLNNFFITKGTLWNKYYARMRIFMHTAREKSRSRNCFFSKHYLIAKQR